MLSGFPLLLDKYKTVSTYFMLRISSKDGEELARICHLTSHFLVGLGVGDYKISSNFFNYLVSLVVCKMPSPGVSVA